MVHEISINELRQALAEGKVRGFYDNRSLASFQRMHIKGSTSLPVPDAAAGKGLPADKGAFLVFY